mmetsp:Transcript_7259/g.17667  ORF Transcript_7259/g.17667 Transcript_7259/m.17667 type:complete len:98 (-) Transcript_7259:903-1196(-)
MHTYTHTYAYIPASIDRYTRTYVHTIGQILICLSTIGYLHACIATPVQPPIHPPTALIHSREEGKDKTNRAVRKRERERERESRRASTVKSSQSLIH